METVTITFTPVKEDFTRSLRRFQLRTWPMRIMLICSASLTLMALFIFTISALLVLSEGSTEYIGTMCFPLICLTVIALPPLLTLVVVPWMTARQVQQNERLRAETTWIVDDERIQITTGPNEIKQDWPTFHEMIDTREHYLMTYALNKRQFQIIPKRAFTSSEHEAAFRALVEEHLGSIKK
jgi:hypothetical protein